MEYANTVTAILLSNNKAFRATGGVGLLAKLEVDQVGLWSSRHLHVEVARPNLLNVILPRLVQLGLHNRVELQPLPILLEMPRGSLLLRREVFHRATLNFANIVCGIVDLLKAIIINSIDGWLIINEPDDGWCQKHC